MEWGGGEERVLMVRGESGEPVVRLGFWSEGGGGRVVEVKGLRGVTGERKVRAEWLGKGGEGGVWGDDGEKFVIGSDIVGEDVVGEYEAMFDDSMLRVEGLEEEENDEGDDKVEDTFQFRGQRRLGTGL